ncbi:U3 snoRNP protein [Malassezia caprae]|uniref:U3 snoRNP protein n=1 Tax=Malassezia caprae TaxID=1381934 RepID=A0AAF0E8T6_9BASI|nr:U3 snoRNP protein [Malassezia caprae]
MGDSAVRHRYVSFHERLKHVTIDLSRDSSTSWGASRLQVAGLDAPASAFAVATGAAPTVTEASDLQSTAFGSALQQWNELNLSLPFQSFHANVMPKALSLVLLVHHRDEIAAELDAGLTLRDPQNWLAWDALLDLVPRMAFDLGSEFLPVYPTLLTALLRASSLMDKNLTRGDEELAARLVERAFHSAAWLFRAVSSLMVRSSDAQLLVASWTIVRDLLTADQAPAAPVSDDEDTERTEHVPVPRSMRPVARSHTRRFATEALAHLIRKAPLSQLGVLVHTMRVDSQTYGPALDSGIAATWAHSCKTAAHALHSRSRELLSCVLEWDAPFASSIERWGERIMTALVHHARAPDMAPVLEWLLHRATESPLAELPTCLMWLIAALGTRKGTRIEDSFKAHFFAWLPKLDGRMIWSSSAAHVPLLRAYTSLICVVLPLARLQDMTGPGKQVLQAFATRHEHEPFEVAWSAFDGVYRALGDPALAWRSFGALALPTALDATSQIFSGDATAAQEEAALALLAALDAQGHLTALHSAPPTTIVLRWTKRTQKKVQQRLDRLASLLDSGQTDDVLASMSAVPLACRFPSAASAMARLLVRCIQAAASSADSKATRYMDGIQGSLLASLVTVLRTSSDAQDCVKVLFDGEPSVFARLLQASVSSHAVLPALADLAQVVDAPASLPSVTHMWPILTSALLDSNRAIVHAALRLLALVTEAPLNVFALLAEVEAIPLDVPNVTARNVKLRYAQREACKALKGSDLQMQALVRYAIGTLKLNLKPVWAASRETLVALSARVSEEVWRVSFAELQAADALVHAGPEPSDEMDEEEAPPDIEPTRDDARDDLYQLHDPQLTRRLRTLQHIVRLDGVAPAQRVASVLQVRMTPHVRFDAAHYTSELLQLYEQHAVLPEKHSEAFVSHVLAQWVSLVDAPETDPTPSAARMERLRQFLAVFAEFRDPARMHRASDMQGHFLSLCAQPEITLQRGALSCLLTWKPPALVHMEDKLRNLLDTAKFRDTLSQLDLSATSEQFSAVTRTQVMPVLVRLLYGLMISRRGVRTSGAGQQARRTAILSALYESRVEELQLLVDLMLGAFADQVVTQPFVLPPPPEAPMRKQLGLLQMLGDVLRHLGRALQPCMHRLVGVVVSLAAHAVEAEDEQAREVRRAALRRLADFVQYGHGTNWSEFREVILTRLVHPRLATFAQDSVQSSSAFLDLCRSWISETDTLKCFLSDTTILPAVYAGLSNTSIKPPVAQTILDMAERLLSVAEGDDEEAAAIRDQVVLPMVPALLEHLQPLVRHTIRTEFSHPFAMHVRDDLLRQELSVLSQLAPHIATQAAAAKVVELLVPLMRHSARAIPERTKTELLRTFSLLLPRAGTSGAFLDDLYGLFCRLGSELRSRQARGQYAEAFAQLATADPGLTRITQWVRALNAYSTRMVDEPDLEQRLTACDEILSEDTVINVHEWHALLYHALFYICDDELAMRTNASAMLQRFVREAHDAECVSLATRVLLPGMRRRLHSRSEAVRKELFQLLGVTVAEMSEAVPALAELHVLRAGGDEEASVFTNLYHIQTHRRVRAMHRLAQAAESGALRSKTLSDLFLPLTWFFLLPNQSGGIDMNMANEALACIRRMAAQLQWSHYYHWLTRFLRELKEHAAKEETSPAERLHVRGVVGVLEAFHFDCNEEVNSAAAPEDDLVDDQAYDGQALARDLTQPLDAQRDQRVALAATLTTRVLPPLHEALQVKDEDRLPARLPLIVGAARLAQHLPQDRRQVELFKVFASLANALRSKLQSTRDACRETALHMLRAIGVEYLAGVVRELRRLLTRGPQLAVCAYTVHSLVVALSTGDEPLLTRLDDGVRDMVEAAMEDVFGLTAEDRAAVEYRTKVRELRQSKSIDTFDHLARLAVPTRVQELLLPLRGVLAASIETKTLRNVDECLRRIASGLSANAHIDTHEFLVLCYTLIAKGEKALAQPPASAPHLAQNAPKFVELGLELLTTALRRSRFDVHDEGTVARLLPLVKAVGETLYATNGPVIERGLRAAAALARCPLPNLAEALPVMQKQMLVLLRSAGGLHSAMAQAALRALSVVLREGRAPAPPTRQLTELLTLVEPELETPVAQASVFALLRAIVSRAFVVPEIYDIMDRIAELLVVSHDAQVRDICRSLYLQFLLDYPQGQGRLQSQMQFLAKHLNYEKQGGRQSVLELVGAVLSKFSTDVVSQFSELFFVALVMLLANEESIACRQQAAQVLGTLLGAVHAPQRATLMQMTRAWATAQGSTQAQQLASVALRVYELAAERDQSSVAQDACAAIVQALQLGAEEGDADAWRYVYQALQTMQSLVQRDPRVWAHLALAKEPLLTLLTFPHAWCRVSACRVLGASFASEQSWAPSDLVRAAKQLVSQLHSPFLDDALTLQVVRNLVFLGKTFAVGIDEEQVEDDESEDDDDESKDDEDDETGNDEAGDEASLQDEGPSVPARLAWLFTKLSHAARLQQHGRHNESAPKRAGAVLKWFAAMTSQLEAPVVSRFLVHILSPILRIVDDEQAPDDLKTLANEVQDMVQEHVGPVAFTRVYAHVKQTLLDKRRARKHSRLLETIADPERAAKRRATRNAGKHMSRKRKNQAFKGQRVGNKRAKGTMRDHS